MNANTALLDEYEQLSKQKDTIEAEIAAIGDELTSGPNPAGLRGPLVDAEGFPRADIDVYRVRHQRHAFACKQTDHRMVMERIEKLLPQLIGARKLAQPSAPAKTAPPPPPAAPMSMVAQPSATAVRADKLAEIQKTKAPFAVVESVQDDSPAALAGLLVGDRVLTFGTADATNHRDLEAIRDIVLRNVGSAIPMMISRQSLSVASAKQDDAVAVPSWEVQELSLTPQKWQGAGVLGCLLVPFGGSTTSSQP